MAIADRLEKRLKNVPGIMSAEIADWIAEATNESGLTEGIDVDTDNALMNLTIALVYETVVQDSARFFQYTDGDESVDKTNVFENYRQLARDARKQYRKYRNGGGSGTYTPGRADGR